MLHGVPSWLSSVLLIADLLVVAFVAHLWITFQDAAEKQNGELETVNSDLAKHEDEIARANEELRSHTQALQRQSEELRIANKELAERENVLRSLLDLSRALTTELSRDETMSRICETLGNLITDPGAAVAILEQAGEQLIVRCHYGFGNAGISSSIFPMNESFAALVLSQGQTRCVEDLTLRPDLQIPQSREGAAFCSILAAPLRVRGVSVGTLEVYAAHKTVWTPHQIALTESLAAQTSVSLEAAELFQEVSRERQKFETVVRTMPFAVVVADASCADVRLNPAGAALFGAPADVNVARQLREWTLFSNGKPLPAESFPVVRACREGVDIIAEELEWITRTGRHVALHANARPIRDNNAVVSGAVAAFIDITPQKELQNELDSRRREAEEASVRKTRFLAAVSHDIRTPANAISLLAELVRRTAAKPALVGEVPALAEDLHSSAISLVNLLSDVLDVARFDSGKVEIQETEFILGDLLDEARRQMLPLAREKSLDLQWSTPGEPVHVRTDRIKLVRVLGNLIGNAIKFTDKGTVRIETDPPNGDGVVIRVMDTGMGIPPEAQSHIFDEFFQLRNPERDRNKGAGLGLAICKRLMDAMAGTLEVSSEPGKGTTFTVRLPRACVSRHQEMKPV